MNVIIIILISIFSLLTVLMCLQESKKRSIRFIEAFLICLAISPFFGYFIISSIKLRNPVGCKWCGNTENEVEFCGICHKNAQGQLRDKN